jgi:hypothetical protein
MIFAEVMMNSLVERELPILKATQALREQLMNALTNDDLTYKLPGENPTLGELCFEMGEIENSYIQSFKTFTQDFNYRSDTDNVGKSVEKLKAWYQTLDAELETVLSGLSDDDIQNKHIERGHGFSPPVGVQFHVYREALLICYAKADVYLRAMGKRLDGQWLAWIG